MYVLTHRHNVPSVPSAIRLIEDVDYQARGCHWVGRDFGHNLWPLLGPKAWVLINSGVLIVIINNNKESCPSQVLDDPNESVQSCIRGEVIIASPVGCASWPVGWQRECEAWRDDNFWVYNAVGDRSLQREPQHIIRRPIAWWNMLFRKDEACAEIWLKHQKKRLTKDGTGHLVPILLRGIEVYRSFIEKGRRMELNPRSCHR